MNTPSIDHLPSQPGIYIFKSAGKPIYIGKSINIKARVKSHIAAASLSAKEASIIEESTQIDFETTLSDFDAIILEAKLIQKFRPKYNVIWKDGKSFLYIKITIKDPFPKVLLARAEQDNRSLYYGPFQSSKVAEELMRVMRRIVPFCTQPSLSKKPCFYAKIGFCSPCPNILSQLTGIEYKSGKKQYRTQIKKVVALLSGESSAVHTQLEKDLNEVVLEKDFEKAIQIRNRMMQFTRLMSLNSFEDPVATHRYSDKDIAQELNEFLVNNFSRSSSAEYRVECYDISNLQGTDPTGSLVVYQDGRYLKSQYRRFKIRTVKKISDFDMHKEMLTRRLRRKDWQLPDLLIIDGGKPQVAAAQKILIQEDINIPLIGLAKSPDRIVFPSGLVSRKSPQRNTALFRMFQALRDESHRFAKKYHVHLRSKKISPV